MTETRIDDRAVRWAVDGVHTNREAALAALASRPLLLLMHGYGSFEGDLIELSPRLPRGFVCASPRALFVAPPPIVNGFAWWPLEIGANGLPVLQNPPAEFVGSAPYLAALALLDWLDELSASVQREHGTGMQEIALLGFSQGGCMVTSLLRLRPERFVCGVNCSGFVAPGNFAGDAELARLRPPMFWGRDELDPIIDAERIALTQRWAPAHTALEAHLYEGVLHSIGLEELDDISAFLRRQLPSLGDAAA